MAAIWNFIKQSFSDALDKTTSWFSDKTTGESPDHRQTETHRNETEQQLILALKQVEESKEIIDKKRPGLSYAKLLLELKKIEIRFPDETEKFEQTPLQETHAFAIYKNLNNKLRILDHLSKTAKDLTFNELIENLADASSSEEIIIFLEIYIDDYQQEKIQPNNDNFSSKDQRSKQTKVRKWAQEIADLDEQGRNEFLANEPLAVKQTVEDILRIRAERKNKPLERIEQLCESCGRPQDYCSCSR